MILESTPPENSRTLPHHDDTPHPPPPDAAKSMSASLLELNFCDCHPHRGRDGIRLINLPPSHQPISPAKEEFNVRCDERGVPTCYSDPTEGIVGLNNTINNTVKTIESILYIVTAIIHP